MKVVGIIPVRLKSSRLPQKALLEIEGLPMILHTYKRALLSKNLDAVYVATDSEKIKSIIEAEDGQVIMTGSHHQTGSDRIAEAARRINAEIIVNIQGDEPLLDPFHVDKVVQPLLDQKDVQVAVLVMPYSQRGRLSDIKAVLDLNDDILYCSRADLPSDARCKADTMWKMCFIVPFRKDFLLQYSSWQQTPLEKIEFNEYLRILEKGFKIRAVKADFAQISVDTPEDLEIVREKMKADLIKQRYL